MTKYLANNDITVTKFLDEVLPAYQRENRIDLPQYLDTTVTKFLADNDISVTKFLDQRSNDVTVTKFLANNDIHRATPSRGRRHGRLSLWISLKISDRHTKLTCLERCLPLHLLPSSLWCQLLATILRIALKHLNTTVT